MTDLATLAGTLLANFRAVRVPAPNIVRPKPGRVGGGIGAASREAGSIRLPRSYPPVPDRAGYRFLDCPEADPDDEWRLHIFIADHAGLSFLEEVTFGACSPGDPVDFDPEEFVRDRLRDCRWANERT
jgi:hypothetical protein